jgi:hypothetical protein
MLINVLGQEWLSLFHRKKCFREWLGNIALTSTAGILIGAAMMSIIFIFEYFIGWVHIVGIESNDIIFLLRSAIAYLVTGITEEIMMRGYIFQNIGEKFPIWAATLANGIIFGILHFNSPGFVWMFIVGAVIITLFLVITRLTSGAIWFAIGWHASWDWGQTSLFGLSEVGKPDFGHAFLHVTQNGPTIFVGIAPSIESGFLIISITLLASAMLIFFVRQIGHLIAWKSKLDSNGAPYI